MEVGWSRGVRSEVPVRGSPALTTCAALAAVLITAAPAAENHPSAVSTEAGAEGTEEATT